MSVEKFNPKILGEIIPYTQVNTRVIQEIDNMEAGFVWVYLLTLPKDWKVVKAHLANHFKMGKAKIKKIFAYLKSHNLIEYIRERLPNGQLSTIDIRVLNGSRFIKIPLEDHAQPSTENQLAAVQATGTENDAQGQLSGDYVQIAVQPEDVPDNSIIKINKLEVLHTTGSENHPLVDHTYGFQPTTNKTINKVNKKKERKDICASGDARESFDRFWKIHPRKKNKSRAFQIWCKMDCHAIAEEIIEKLRLQVLHDSDWKDVQFVPHPSTYLHNKRWEDEIASYAEKKVHPVTASIREIKEEMKTKGSTSLLLN
jgi:hypothetical protein